MKQINVVFEDDRHKEFVDLKKELKLNWHNFLLELLNKYKKEVKNGKNNR